MPATLPKQSKMLDCNPCAAAFSNAGAPEPRRFLLPLKNPGVHEIPPTTGPSGPQGTDFRRTSFHEFVPLSTGQNEIEIQSRQTEPHNVLGIKPSPHRRVSPAKRRCTHRMRLANLSNPRANVHILRSAEEPKYLLSTSSEGK